MECGGQSAGLLRVYEELARPVLSLMSSDLVSNLGHVVWEGLAEAPSFVVFRVSGKRVLMAKALGLGLAGQAYPYHRPSVTDG